MEQQTTSHLLIEHVDLLDPQAPRGIATDHSIWIEGNRIRRIAPASALNVSTLIQSGVRGNIEVINGRGLFAMPGLVNAHTHSPENYMRGATECMPLEPWLVWLYGTCGEYTARDHYLCAAMSAVEMLLSGVTASLDHVWHGGAWQREYLDAAMQAYRDAGIRAAVAPMFDDHDYVLDVADALGHDLRGSVYGQSHGGYRPDRDAYRRAVLHDTLAMLDEWMRDWHGSAEGRLQAFLGPAAGQLVTEECMQASLALARKHGAGVHMHCVETRVQDYCIRQVRGKSLVQWLAEIDVLTPELSLPHSVWVRDPADLDLLAARGAVPVHNPAANLKLGSGLMPMRAMLDRGITVALGVDGACSSDNQNLFDAIKLAALIHNLNHHDPKTWITAREAFEAATLGGAAALLLRDQLGALREGWLADVVLLDLNNPVLAPHNDAFGMLVHCETGQSVRHVIVNGHVVVRDRQLLTLNAAELVAEFTERARALPFRQPLDAKTQDDIARCWRFWWDVMTRVTRSE
ncbi:MAG: amidohydrolase family protein [Anaerolineae bacterium]|nr:amidohydrolase family protein [Thermoflexales bacterium]MDW8054550.1 amidohydrolase family protein [Anaerolineae bacterium]